MGQNKINETDLKRNCLCVRWNDGDHKRLTDLAWQQRISCSEYVRTAVYEQFKREGVEQQQTV